MSGAIYRLVWVAVIGGALVFSAHAEQLGFTKIADADTSIPGASGTFDGYLGTPAIDGQDVVFAYPVSTQTTGIYKYLNGTLLVVADPNTAIPGGTGNFTSVATLPSISGGVVAFVGAGSSGQAGVYTDPNGLSVVADASTSIPGGSGDFVAFGGLWIEGDDVVFRGMGSNDWEGIYIDDGTLRMVADPNTVMPSDPNEHFAVFLTPALGGSIVGFPGWASDRSPGGIYADDNGTQLTVADDGTSIPEGTGTFGKYGFTYVSVDDNGDVVFRGKGSSGQAGIYTYIDSTLQKVVDMDDTVPGTANPSGFSSCGIDGGSVAFTVQTGGLATGVYTNIGGSLCKIAKAGDTVDGKTVYQAIAGVQCISGNRIVFWMSYDTGTKSAVYTAYFCPGDLDDDGDVDLADLSILLSNYGESGTRSEGDINGDGEIDATDKAILLANYNTTCPD